MKTASPKPDETEENRVNPESVPIIILDQSVSVFQPEIANSTINVKNKHVSQNSVELTNVCSKNDLEVTETNSRPVRNRTKNKKYFDDNMLTDVSLSKKESTVKQTNIPDVVISSANSMSEQCDNKGSSSSNNTRRGTKRLSDSDTIEPLKKKKAVIDQGDGGVIVTENGKSGSDVSGRNPTSAKDDLGSMEAEPHRSRTRTLTKPTVSNIVVISPYSNSDVPKSKDSPTKPSDKTTPVNEITKPEQRMTRTKTKEIGKTQANALLGDGLKNAEKENKTASQLSKIISSADKRHKTTPLAANNFIFSPYKKIKTPVHKVDPSGKKIESSATKIFSKEDAASVKKKEMMKALTEETRRKREEREQRHMAQKLAVQKEKELKLARLRKENEEKQRIIAENKRLKEEQVLQKKQNTEALLKEAEERRIKEEEAKRARLKKMEEEKKRLAQERLKQSEDARKLHEMRLANQAKEKEASRKALEEKQKNHVKKAHTDSYDLTPAKEDCLPKPPKSENDYGLSDVDSGDSTDDERQPKKKIPRWASKSARMKQVLVQSYVHSDLIVSFFPFIDKITRALMASKNCRPRASSAVWNTPDL